ncbi:MAG: hypothetical protein C0497_02930 [Gemmatimonas sp.]|nr:hypothetical protein [Gemmatimonas sp.]
MSGQRAADALYNSEAVLRLVMSELGALRRRTTPVGSLLRDDEPSSMTPEELSAVEGAEAAVLGRI